MCSTASVATSITTLLPKQKRTKTGDVRKVLGYACNWEKPVIESNELASKEKRTTCTL